MVTLIFQRHTRQLYVTARLSPGHIPQHWARFITAFNRRGLLGREKVCAPLNMLLVYDAFVEDNV